MAHRFSLEWGFTKIGDLRWKSFKNLIIVNIHVLQEEILIDAVNSNNNEFGVIILRVEDKFSFCCKRLMKNYSGIPHVYQVLMGNIKYKCKVVDDAFQEIAVIASTYFKNAIRLHAATLTVGIVNVC